MVTERDEKVGECKLTKMAGELAKGKAFLMDLCFSSIAYHGFGISAKSYTINRVFYNLLSRKNFLLIRPCFHQYT